MKKQNGITLIALIITILVMLILAGVAISMAIGEDGVIQQAGNAQEKSAIAQIVEETKIEVSNKQISKEGKVYKDDFIAVLESKGTLSGEGDILDKTLTTNDGNYQIPVRDIYDGMLYEIPTITFKIGTTEYIAEEGMTWLEWVNSEYNTNGYTCSDNKTLVIFGGGFVSTNDEYQYTPERFDYGVIGSEKIKNNFIYCIQDIAG